MLNGVMRNREDLWLVGYNYGGLHKRSKSWLSIALTNEI